MIHRLRGYRLRGGPRDRERGAARTDPGTPRNPDPGEERRRVERTYQRYAEDPRSGRRWSASNPGNVAIREELVDRVFALAGDELTAARQILDIGCGTGWWLALLAARGDVQASLHGIDILPERLTAARTRVPSAELRSGDARDLPYGEHRFDVVTMYTVLSSLSSGQDVERALREARRVLAPGGVLLVWEPRIPNPLNRGTVLLNTRLVSRALPGARLETRTLTVLPALARRLGAAGPWLYPRLARIAPLRTHRLYRLSAGE